ncbi:MAG: uracil-DNA glycosylase family protein, partial [Ktedonobacterales bacterium]
MSNSRLESSAIRSTACWARSLPGAILRSATLPNTRNARTDTATTLDALLAAVRACRACAGHLPLGPRPVLRAAASARILIVGQAPGLRVHTSGVPWDDPSGERLRD